MHWTEAKMTPIKFFLPAALVVAACWWAGPATAQSTADKVTPTELLAKQDQLTNKPVVVQGTLSNSGTNYFTDLRVILKDNTDAAAGVIVQPWLPIETRQQQTDGTPPTAKLSDFLGKKVEIHGMLTDSVVKHVGPAKILRVESVRILD
jgi:hypothetical protein